LVFPFSLLTPNFPWNMSGIVFRATDIREIEVIRLLWKNLNEHHRARAGVFSDYYSKISFEDRKEYFKRRAASGNLRLDLALDAGTDNRCVGYCVTSLSGELEGEIESILVEQSFRSAGIGKMLVTRALAWLDGNGSTRNRVSVGFGNESSWEFYRKCGFYPRMTVLEQRKE